MSDRKKVSNKPSKVQERDVPTSEQKTKNKLQYASYSQLAKCKGEFAHSIITGSRMPIA